MELVMSRLVAAAEIVIFDTPPTGPVSDAVMLSRLADGVLIVATSRRTRSATLVHASEAVTRASARIIGVVLNGTGREAGEGYYGYDDEHQQRPAREVTLGVPAAQPADRGNR
jgi:Mrp family chromosome partitioning ATPase